MFLDCFDQKVSKKIIWGVGSTPLGKGRVKIIATCNQLNVNIKLMPCVEGDRSDCQPEASSIA